MIPHILAMLMIFTFGACAMDIPYKSANYDRAKKAFVNPTGKGEPNLSLSEMAKLTKRMLWDSETRIPKGKLPESHPNVAEFLKPSESLKFIWMGHSTLLLNVNQKIILIDPVFSDNASPTSLFVKRFQAPVLKLEDLPPIDAIVISHNHYDHLDKETILFFKNKHTRFILPLGVGEDLLDWGIKANRIVELDWFTSYEEFGISFIATPAQHFSGRGLFDKNKSLWASWVIKTDKQNIFYSGDTGYSDHFKKIGDKYGPFDVAFLENGQYNKQWPDIHMQPEETLQAFIDLNAELLVPVHWGMFDLSLHHWAEPAERTYVIAKAWDIPLLTPELGQIIDLDYGFETRAWWREVQEEVTFPKVFQPANVGMK